MNKNYYGFNYMIKNYKKIVRNWIRHKAKLGWTQTDIYNFFMNKYEVGGSELDAIIEREVK